MTRKADVAEKICRLIRLGTIVILFPITCLQFVYAQTTQPAADTDADTLLAEPEIYDLWTSPTLTGQWGGAGPHLKELGIQFLLSYQSQLQQNVRGGLDTHNAHDFSGSYDATLKLDFEKMGLLENAGFYMKARGSYGDGMDDTKVGTLSMINSDGTGDQEVSVPKWWFWQRLLDDKIELRLGLIMSDKDLFDISLYANHEDMHFLNRWSIRNPLVPHGNGIGAYLKIEPTDWLYVQAMARDAHYRPRRVQFDTAFHDEAWFIGLWELGVTPEWNTPKGPMPGRYRVGLWYDPRPRRVFEDDLDGRRENSYAGDDVGFYAGFDQMVWRETDNPADRQGLGFYGRYGHAHDDVHKRSEYFSAGLSYTGLLPARDEDVCAFGVAQAIPSSRYRREVEPQADRETVYEWFYSVQVTPWCTLTPDLQIITDPGGNSDSRDAIIGGLRLRIIF